MKITPYWQLRLPLILVLADLAWIFSALAPQTAANPAAGVGMSNSVVWIFLHLPAVALGGMAFDASPSQAGPLPKAEMILIGFLGLAQMGALAWWAGRMLDKKRKP